MGSCLSIGISLMKQRFIVTHRYTVLQEIVKKKNTHTHTHDKSFIEKSVMFLRKYRVIRKSVKYFKNSQQIDRTTDHGNSYVDRERNCLSFFFKEKPAHIVALICR